MAIHDILSALVDQWERVSARLDERGRAVLRGLVTAMADAGTADARKAGARRILHLLLTRLPDDPVLDAGDGPVRRSADTLDVDRALARLATHLHTLGSGPRTAEEKVLAGSWESAFDLRRRGVDPDLPDLIRLRRPAGGCAVPGFQLDAQGQPIPVVLRVNRVLGAWQDPWGAADWWLNANVWLRDPPSTLIGNTPDDLLVAAATAAVSG
ncbi:hypothetical protein FHS29_006197 [Saccharothrix tamanrassetensis]|uniref:Uncharacterized protein n=1 Tax=Saccharothrix tamanrassetensis TaxID=1051531 RepID=A0A841CW24_9PSEU|nr:hypothetical protein [Saccharothrix tamanrassetensis]MBB5959576.1 hypothetical protein [Saccharothrix tamanrassetensis]